MDCVRKLDNMPEKYFGTTHCLLIYNLKLYEILSHFDVNVEVL